MSTFLAVLALVFVVLALIDVALKRQGVISADYLQTRLIVTMIVVISLLLALLATM